ncbi:hypothetical protein KC219_24355, partial [Mycobacterium tuberculosis]|nr:hypothetical protein [Mycobacterium tuberculosis]
MRVSAALPAEAWGTIDDLELVREPVPGADTSQLRERRDAAAALDLAAYVEASTDAVPGAIARADIVLAATSPSAST